MTRARVLVGVGVLLALLLAAELVAPRLAQRALERALAPCVVAEGVEVTALARPVLPGLVVGRVRAAEVVATGVQLGELRVERIEVALTDAPLPWSWRSGAAAPPVEVLALVTAPDAREALWAVAPLGLRPTLRLEGGEVVIGAPGLGIDVRLAPVVEVGRIALVPALGPPGWWTALGLALATDLPDGVVVSRLDVGEGRVQLEGSVDLDALGVGAGQGGGCPAPVVGAAP